MSFLQSRVKQSKVLSIDSELMKDKWSSEWTATGHVKVIILKQLSAIIEISREGIDIFGMFQNGKFNQKLG